MQINLYKIRKEQEMSQADVAKILDITRHQYGKKESGKAAFTQDEMFELSRYFERPIEDIFLPRSNQNGN